GDWVEVSFRKPLVAYVRPESDKVAPVIGEGSSEPGVIFDNEKTAKAASAPIADRGAVATDGILRAFEGQLSKPRSFFFFKPPYEFQLVDASGNRIAYLDLSRLLITTPLEHFLGREF